MSTRRPLGTGPTDPRPATPEHPPRLLPVERAATDEHQDQAHSDPRARGAGGPVPGRRKLGDRGQ
ncbi:hypothetical protein [Streptomyces sp. NPDC051132]|uniref:hypothetical protein n=1 Tax=unclassified Streptomyces TaxID=2593676 RepID=UPI0034178451